MTSGLRDAIAEVLRGLPVREDRRKLIESNAFSLLISCAVANAWDVPRARKGGTKRAAKDLATLRDRLLRVCETIYTMPSEAHSALNAELAEKDTQYESQGVASIACRSNQIKSLLAFGDDAFALSEEVEAARLAVLGHPESTRPGRPQKFAAARVTDHALAVYETLTGTCATVAVNADSSKASGPFLKFISELYSAIGVDASPESQAKAAIRRRDKGSKEKSTA